MAINVNATKEALAAEYASLGDYISLHTDNPSTTGANEATGGSPAYARKQTTWSAGGSDGVYTGSQVTIDVPAGTYTHVGIFDASSSGNFIDYYELPDPIVMSAQGQIRVTPTFTQS